MSVERHTERAAQQMLADRGRFPSGGAVPFDVALSLITAALRGRDNEQEVCSRLAHRMQVACDRTRAGKDHVKVATADWHGLMDIVEQARAALHHAKEPHP